MVFDHMKTVRLEIRVKKCNIHKKILNVILVILIKIILTLIKDFAVRI